MALTLKDGTYIKIKDGSITTTGLQYYSFKNKAVRDAVKDLSKEHINNLEIVIDMTVKPDSTKSLQDNLKTLAYTKMKTLTLKKSSIVTVEDNSLKEALDS